MGRTNIFELLQQSNDIGKDAERLHTLFEEYYIAGRIDYKEDFSLKEFVDKFCFCDWKNRKRCIDLVDYLEVIGYERLYMQSHRDTNAFLTYIELIYNFWYMATAVIDANTDIFEYYRPIDTLQELMDSCLSELNQKAYYFKDKEQCIIAEDSPQVTAAAEISVPEVALEIVRYNSNRLAGNIGEKKKVLLALAHELDARKAELDGINKHLGTCIFRALNNLNIRHDNCKPGTKNYKKVIAEMPPAELEEKYDELYQLILLAIVEMDNKPRKAEMESFLNRVEAKEVETT